MQTLGDAVADLFYGRLFDIAPQVRSLFPDDMTAQKRKLVAMLALAVSNLDKPEALVATVRDLGDGTPATARCRRTTSRSARP
nr:globin domain-containing protein [Methylobacterium sp.]